MYDYSNEPQLALDCHHQSLELREQSNANESLIAECYQAIGDVYYFYRLASTNRVEGDIELALEYINLTIQQINDKQSKYNSLLADSYIVKANIFYSSLRYDSAILYYHRAIQMDISLNQSRSLSNYYTNIASCYIELQDYKRAIYYCRMALEGNKNLLDTAELSNIFSVLGEAFDNIEEQDSSYYYLSKSLSFRSGMYGKLHPETAVAYHSLAKHYRRFSVLDSAMASIQKALAASLEGAADYNRFIFLAEKGYILTDLYRNHNNSLHYLELAVESFDLAMDALTSNRKAFRTEGSHLFTLDHHYHILEGALECLNLLYRNEPRAAYVNQAFHFMEMGKAVLLMESLNQASLKTNVGLPDSIVKLTRQIESKIVLARQKSDTSAMNSLLKKQQNLQQQIAKQFPNYHQAAYADNEISIQQVQNLLDSDEILVEYYWGDSAVYLVALEQQSTHFFKLNRNEEVVERYSSELRRAPSFKDLAKQFKDYCATASEVYQTYLAPLLSCTSSTIKEIVVVPDGPLVYAPFEATLVSNKRPSKVDYQSLSYLVHSYEISYAYSAKWLLQSRSKSSALIDPQVLAFGYGSEDELAGTNAELQAIRTSFSGKFFCGSQATKDNFLAYSEGFDIIHLATHGQADMNNRTNSALIFRSSEGYDTLTVNEVYDLPLSNKITILTACESGFGRLYRGEGVYSIARAFAYTGSKSTVVGHWKIGDQSSSAIIRNFYQNLEGNTISKALRNAKLAYLDNDDHLLSHPNYWAGLVVVGDMAVSSERDYILLKTSAALVLFVLIACIIVIMRKPIFQANVVSNHAPL